MGEKGCRHLSKAAWGELEEISLCHCSLTQGETKSGTGAVRTSAGEVGKERKKFGWVLIKIFRWLWREGGGVQGDGQAEGAPGVDHLYIGSNSGFDNKIEVAGSRFLRGVAGKVNCDEEYRE